MSNQALFEPTYSLAHEREKICGLFLKQLHSRVMAQNTSKNKKANMLITLAFPTVTGAYAGFVNGGLLSIKFLCCACPLTSNRAITANGPLPLNGCFSRWL